MKALKTTRSKKKPLMVALVITGALLAGSLAFVAYNNLWPFANENPTPEDTVDLEAPSEEQVDAGNEIKKQNTESSKPNSAATQTSNNTNGTVAAEITYADKESNALRIGTLIQEVSTTGNCTVTLSKTGQASISKTAKTQPLASASTCQGFTIDTANLAKGTWKLTLTYKSDKSNGTSSRDVTL